MPQIYLIQTGNEIFTTCPIMSLFLMPHKEVESCVGGVRWHFSSFLSPLGQETIFVSKINRSSWIQFLSNESFAKIWDEFCPEGKANHRPSTGHRCVTVELNGEHKLFSYHTGRNMRNSMSWGSGRHWDRKLLAEQYLLLKYEVKTKLPVLGSLEPVEKYTDRFVSTLTWRFNNCLEMKLGDGPECC